MANRLVKTPRFKIIPGTPGRPAIPPVCTTEKKLVGYQDVPAGCTTGITYIWIPANPIMIGDVARWMAVPTTSCYPASVQPVYKETQKCTPGTPGTPGTPAQVIPIYDGSWNDGAHSIAMLAEGMAFSLDISASPIAVMVGLGRAGIEYSFDALNNGVIIRDKTITHVQRGIEGHPVPIATNKLIISRHPDRIDYIAGGQVIASHSPGSTGAHVYVLLYGAMDYVENPAFIPIRDDMQPGELRIETELRATPGGLSEFKIEALGEYFQSGLSVFRIQSEGVALAGYEMHCVASDTYSIGYAAIPRRAKHDALIYGDVSIGAGYQYAIGAAGPQNRAHGRWPGYTVDGRISRVERQPVMAVGGFGRISSTGWLLNGGSLAGEGRATAIGKASDKEWLGGSVKVMMRPVLKGVENNLAQGYLKSDDNITASAWLEMESVMLFALFEGVDISCDLDIYMLVSMAFHESIITEGPITFGGLLEMIFSDGVLVSQPSTASASRPDYRPDPSTPPAMREALQYAVNATTGALSRYENFGFTQFAHLNGSTFAIADDGLYELKGQDDAGDMLQALIDFGASDYGTAQSKRVSSVYAGIATDGQVYIRVAGDYGADKVYRAISRGDEARAFTAKGLTARHWRLRLELVDASYADLDNMEVEIGAGQRRLRRGK